MISVPIIAVLVVLVVASAIVVSVANILLLRRNDELRKLLFMDGQVNDALATSQAMLDSLKSVVSLSTPVFKPETTKDLHRQDMPAAEPEKQPRQDNSEHIWSFGDVIHCETCACMVRKDLAVRGKSRIKLEIKPYGCGWQELKNSERANEVWGCFDDGNRRETIVTPYYCKRCAPKEPTCGPKASGGIGPITGMPCGGDTKTQPE